eukprot:CAMPEP_0174308572 /NCGR_PEP_ID=MMETSP0810-20121108/1848_1 /TAXON_ID=73025 ORGANISM="Eutreptiella gymnastica-like, Strain CCMP1594" /NCGR_SAMPLE_ID=MMETSP0810 /ASSEMBLY_ACC=CAM_ASM_000659 /LENGTH=189 /DNA_ID=CAMNT_0015415947 /DNA_START=65 /DNA_END=634 /DNA_ORIENTATION=+
MMQPGSVTLGLVKGDKLTSKHLIRSPKMCIMASIEREASFGKEIIENDASNIPLSWSSKDATKRKGEKHCWDWAETAPPFPVENVGDSWLLVQCVDRTSSILHKGPKPNVIAHKAIALQGMNPGEKETVRIPAKVGEGYVEVTVQLDLSGGRSGSLRRASSMYAGTLSGTTVGTHASATGTATGTPTEA